MTHPSANRDRRLAFGADVVRCLPLNALLYVLAELKDLRFALVLVSEDDIGIQDLACGSLQHELNVSWCVIAGHGGAVVLAESMPRN